MTCPDPDASRSPYGTRVVLRGPAYARTAGMATGQGFRSPSQPDEGRRSLCTVPDQGRICRRAPFLLPSLSTGRGLREISAERSSLKIRSLGFIGAGKMARHHARAAVSLGAEIVAGTTGRPMSRNMLSFSQVVSPPIYGMTVMPDAETLLKSERVEGVVVCAPWDSMAFEAYRAISSEKPALVEKPIALTAYQARGLIGKSKSHRALVGFNRRFYEPVRRLKKRIDQGGLKAANVVISEYIEHHRKTTGSEVIPYLIEFTSVHTIDLMLHLFGPLGPVYIKASKQGEFTNYNGLLRRNDGTPISLSLNADDPSRVGIWCRFDDGTTWVLSPLERLRRHTARRPDHRPQCYPNKHRARSSE